MQPQSAYGLRRRVDARGFRIARELALDHAVQRLAEAAPGRAIRGVAVPVFFQGERIGERRYFDERLTGFILRCRDPVRYGAWIDRAVEARRHPDGAALQLSRAVHNLEEAACAAAGDDPRPRRRLPLQWPRFGDVEDQRAADLERQEDAREAAGAVRREAGFEAWLRSISGKERPDEAGAPVA